MFYAGIDFFFIFSVAPHRAWMDVLYVNFFSLPQILCQDDWLCGSDLVRQGSRSLHHKVMQRHTTFMYVFILSIWLRPDGPIRSPVTLRIYQLHLVCKALFSINLNSQHPFPPTRSLHRKYRKYNLEIPWSFKNEYVVKVLFRWMWFPELVIITV